MYFQSTFPRRVPVWCAWCCAAFCVVALARPLAAQVVAPSLNPTADAFLSAANPNNNYGGAGALSLAGPAATNAKGVFDSLVRFNTASAKSTFDTAYGPGSWTIQSATLRLTSASPNNAIFNSSVAGAFAVALVMDDTWTEGVGMPNSASTSGVTYNNQPASNTDVAIGAFSFDGSTSGTSTYNLPLSTAFAAALAAGADVNLRFTAVDSAVSYLFNARTGPNNSSPLLTLTAVPEPSGALLVAGAGAGLLRCARRRRRPNHCSGRGNAE